MKACLFMMKTAIAVADQFPVTTVAHQFPVHERSVAFTKHYTSVVLPVGGSSEVCV